MRRTSVFWWSFAALLSAALAANPLPPKTSGKNPKIDCNGPIAFAATGSGTVHPTGLVAYRTKVVGLSDTWDRELGVFTCACTGLYQFSFTGATKEDTRMVLKKRLSDDDQWSPVLATVPGGGSATVLLDIKAGDQVAAFLDGGSRKFNVRHEQGGLDVTSFSGHRIAKT